MKKIFLILSAGTILFLSSCGGDDKDKKGDDDDKKEQAVGGMSEKAKKNLESHRGVANMFNTGDFSKIADFIAADATDYAGEMGPVKGVDSIKASFERMKAQSHDMKNSTVREMADDEYVMAWMKFSGTMNGKAFDSEAIEVSQYNADSKVIAHWTFMQPGEVMKMMANMPPPPAKK